MTREAEAAILSSKCSIVQLSHHLEESSQRAIFLALSRYSPARWKDDDESFVILVRFLIVKVSNRTLKLS